MAIIAGLTIHPIPDAHAIVLILMYTGILADIFDGIIARMLGISTEDLRLKDTLIDLLFYVSILLYINSINPVIISDNIQLLSCIIFLECTMYSVSLIRFRKIPSPHAVLSKFWGLYLVTEFTLIILGINGTHFTLALSIGIPVHVDRLLIYLIIKKWDHDIPSSYHAFLLRQGKPIVRLKIFNG